MGNVISSMFGGGAAAAAKKADAANKLALDVQKQNAQNAEADTLASMAATKKRPRGSRLLLGSSAGGALG